MKSEKPVLAVLVFFIVCVVFVFLVLFESFVSVHHYLVQTKNRIMEKRRVCPTGKIPGGQS